jgi:hypothetical protein
MVRAAAIAPKPIASDDGELEFTSGPGTGKARQRAANTASRGRGSSPRAVGWIMLGDGLNASFTVLCPVPSVPEDPARS